MKLRNLLLVILIFSSMLLRADYEQLSDRSKVILFTCGPGSELYAGFGHSAIWVSDPTNGIDRLYNYGTFDFNTPNFYWKFIKGKLNYMLTVTTVRRFIAEYQFRKIEVKGQTLNLQNQEIQELYELLETNLLPENKLYKYDFFYDNCATRIRDIVVESIDGQVDFNTENENLSFREMLFPYLEHSPWTKMGINLILGLSADKTATVEQYMYLPEWMFIEFSNASVSRNENTAPLVSNTKKYLDTRLTFEYNIWTDPALIFGLGFLLLALVTIMGIRKGRHYLSIDITLNIIAVLAGLFLFFMWVGTDHSATNKNLNILWLFPAQALFLVSLFFDKRKRILLTRISSFILLLCILAMQLWPQALEITFLILILIYLFRYLVWIRFLQSH